MEYELISKEEFEKAKEEYLNKFNNFEKRLFNNMELLSSRVNKLKTIKSGTLDYWTYYDSVLVQIRAMFIETSSRKANHTFSELFRARLC